MTSLQAMINMGQKYKHEKCAAKGCTRPRPGLAPLCSSHQLRKSRYGHELGRSIQKKDYREELKEVSNFLEQYRDHPAVISALTFFQNWIDQAAKDEAEVGKAIFGRLYRQGIQPLDLLTEVSAVWMFAERHPYQLPDDLRLSYCLARNAARLAGLERRSYGQSTGMRHPKPTELKTTGEHIRQSLARFFVNLSVALNAKADQVMRTKQNLSIPFI